MGRSSAGSTAGSGRTTPATWSTPRRGACSVPRDHPTPSPDSPTRQQAAEVKMVGYIVISSDTAQRLSDKWRRDACTSVVITYCTSPFYVGVAAKATDLVSRRFNTYRRRRRQLEQPSLRHRALGLAVRAMRHLCNAERVSRQLTIPGRGEQRLSRVLP